MPNMDLRPLSLGEILDRSFALYRGNFALFIGITVIPQLLILALNLAQIFLGLSNAVPQAPDSSEFQAGAAAASPALVGVGVVIGILTVIVFFVAYLLSQGATVSAVADLYVGHGTTIRDSFKKVRRDLGTLFGVVMLNGLAVMGGMILLIIPGIYMACRLMLAVPAAVLENLGPRSSLERSFALTKGSAGRAFLILLLYFVLLMVVATAFTLPATLGAATARNDPAMMRIWMALAQVLNTVGTVLVTPILTIASSVLYFDLRVRKEAFDLQMMMGPGSQLGAAGGVPSMLS
jgi:Membrane domain of glycerophosphoryl diester phosphodiesterase